MPAEAVPKAMRQIVEGFVVAEGIQNYQKIGSESDMGLVISE